MYAQKEFWMYKCYLDIIVCFICFCSYLLIYHPNVIAKNMFIQQCKNKIIKLSLITKSKQAQANPSFTRQPSGIQGLGVFTYYEESESSGDRRCIIKARECYL